MEELRFSTEKRSRGSVTPNKKKKVKFQRLSDGDSKQVQWYAGTTNVLNRVTVSNQLDSSGLNSMEISVEVVEQPRREQ